MDDILKAALGQTPALVVLVVLVIFFFKAQSARDAFIRQLHDEHMAARGESREAIVDNTKALRELANAVVVRNHQHP